MLATMKMPSLFSRPCKMYVRIIAWDIEERWDTYIDLVEKVAATVGCDNGINVFKDEQTRRLITGHLEDVADTPRLGRRLDVQCRDRVFVFLEK